MLDLATVSVVNVEVVRHAKTGLFVATSPDLPTMFVHGRSDDEVLQNVVEAIKTILEAQAEQSFGVSPQGEPKWSFDKLIASFSAEPIAA